MASAPSSDSLFLESDETVQTFVRPLVMLSILDHHQRRKEGQNRVIGALMGRIEDNVVLVTDCFPVTHKDDAGMVLINRADIAAMVKSVRMVNKLESIVGWYATVGSDASTDELVTRHTVPVHDFFGQTYCARPVHLVVDCSLRTDTINAKAFVAAPFSIPSPSGAAVTAHFVETQLMMQCSPPEKLAVSAMLRAGDDAAAASAARSSSSKASSKVVGLPSDAALLRGSVEGLAAKIAAASLYVDAAVARDPRVDATSADAQKKFRQISDVVDSVPKMRPAVFEKSFNDSLQDYLMVSYLTSIMRSQVAAAETLSTNSFF